MTNKKKTAKISTWGKIWRIALAIVVPLGGGLIISLFTRDAMSKFSTFHQPPLAPPAWLFPVAWMSLYVLMGLASYFIWKKGYDSKKVAEKTASRNALIVYGVQLVMNFVWTPLFFSLGWYWFAFAWLMVMWALIIVLLVQAFRISRPAFFMLLPYIIWCTFAAYLNCGIAILN